MYPPWVREVGAEIEHRRSTFTGRDEYRAVNAYIIRISSSEIEIHRAG